MADPVTPAPDAVADANFLVIGAGGLGCPALLGLSMAGARNITVVDHDRVEAHNLQRQVLFSVADVGASKAQAAAFALRRRGEAQSPHVTARSERLTAETLTQCISTAPAGTVVLECTDDPTLKFAANDAALQHGVPVVISAALGWRGQALAVDRAHACYRCIYEAPPALAAVPTCAEAGVIGAGVGMLGFLAAHLAVGLATGQRDVCGQLHHVDLLSGMARPLRPQIRAQCPGPHSTPAVASHLP